VIFDNCAWATNKLTIKSAVENVCKPEKLNFEMHSKHANALEKETHDKPIFGPALCMCCCGSLKSSTHTMYGQL